MAGTGSLSLNDANSYRGKTEIDSGTLFVGANNALGSSNGTVGTIGNTVLLGNTTGSANANLLTTGGFTIANAITVQSGNTGVMTLGGNTVANSIFSGAVSFGTASGTAKGATFVAASGGNVDFQGAISENTSVPASSVIIGDTTHSGSVKFSNTSNGYGGTTSVTNGATLEVVGLGTSGNSSIGNSARSTASNLLLSNGTLKYTGAGESTTRSFSFDANGGTLDASAAANAALTFTGTASASGTGNRTLTLTGSSTGANALQTAIANPSSGATALTKNGTGTWQLAGSSANTYTGLTTVNAGELDLNKSTGNAVAGDLTIGDGSGTDTLKLLAANQISNTAVVTLTNAGSAVFNLNGNSETIGSLTDSAAGASGASVQLGAGTLTVGDASNRTFAGVISGSGGGLVKVGNGTQTLTGTNTFTGSTIISGGTLEAGAAGALGSTSSITVNTGGTLLLSGSGNRINDNTTTFTLAGGTLNTGGLSETLGALTLSSDSIIDFGSGSSILTFADSSFSTWSGSFRLSIYNWSGNTLTGGGTDQLRFLNNGLTAAQLGRIDFYSGTTPGTKLSITPSFSANGFVGGAGEVVPVPEPSSVATVIGLLGLVGWRERRKARLAREVERRAMV